MKNFYTLLTAACVAFSASAVDFNAKDLKIKSFDKVKKQEIVAQKQPVSKAAVTSLKKKVRKAGEETTLEGLWTFTFGDYYFQGSTGSFDEEVNVTIDGSNVYFEGTYYVNDFVATYEESTGTLTFSQMSLGQVSTSDGGRYYMFQDPYVYNYTTQDLDPQDITATFDASLGIITFESDNGIAWVACTSNNIATQAGYFDILDIEDAVKGESTGGGGGSDVPSTDIPGTWTSLGNAMFSDPWLVGFLLEVNPNLEQYSYQVELQQNDDNENIYRLVNPYKGNSPVAQYNTYQGDGYIAFDITDPDHVNFKFSNAGFANSQIGLSAFYTYNILGLYETFGYPADLVLMVIPDDEWGYTKYADGVVTFGSFDDPEEGMQYDAMFGFPGAETTGYTWTGADMTGKIVFPATQGISNVAVDRNQAPVEYFNLQGARISAPAAGTVVIRRQGNEAVKVLVK